MSLTLSDPKSESIREELNLGGPLLEALQNAGYSSATPIQVRAMPLLLEGRDVLGQAQTGTGKTAAFAIPMLQRIDLERNVPQVLVLTPTRELTIQVARSFKRYAGGLKGLRVAAIYGGQDYQVQFRQLDRGVHVVVGTPGRVMDHLRRGSLTLDGLRMLVLDEADEMLRMGFAEDVEWVLTQAPAQRQIALFSATIPESIRRIAQRHLRNPAVITIKQRTTTADTVRQRFVVVDPRQKQNVLARILEAEPIDGVLVFVNTKSSTEPLAEYLSSQGHRTAALSSDVSQNQRERIIDNLRSGKLDVIVATDVAARGLDVPRISHVINYDFPSDSHNYVHRIGRTGRAGRSGQAILFVHPRGRHLPKRMEQATRQTIEPMEIPTAQVINLRRVARFHERITAGMAHPDLATFSGLVEQYRRENDVPLEQIAAGLAALAAGDTPLLLTDDLPDIHSAESRDLRGESRSHSRQRSFDDDRRGERGIADGRSAARMETYRIEVGRAHQVKPTNIVGAIANESGMDSSVIGKIVIFDAYSTVDLLAGMPPGLLHTLKQVRISGRRLNLSRLDEAPASEERPFVEKFQAPVPSEDRPGATKAKAIPDREGRPVRKKLKTKSKPKGATAKSKGSRASSKRLQRTR
jgi:ATP-dependent RNA helicase DeaD